MSTKQFLTDGAIKHQIYLQRYSGSVYKQLASFVSKSIKQTSALLKEMPESYNKKRYETLLEDLKSINKAINNDMQSAVKSSMINLAKYEADFTTRLIKQAVKFPVNDLKGSLPFNMTTPTINQLKTAAFTNIIDVVPGFSNKGASIGTVLTDFGAKSTGNIIQTVRQGYATGRTTVEITKDIEKLGYGVARGQAKALARTITNHTAAQARQLSYDGASDVLKDEYTIVATLDDRTTLTCGALDGKTFPVEDFSFPPYHWNCRTTYIRDVKDEYKLPGLTGSRVAKGEDDEIQKNIPVTTKYPKWIAEQPLAFQVDVLGEERAKLLNAGMQFEKFVDRNYNPIDLEELRTKDNEHIFKKAGL